MAIIYCPRCGETHKYTATALATLLQAALDGELHTVGIEDVQPRRRHSTAYRRAVVVQTICPLTLVSQYQRPVKHATAVY